LEKLQPSIRPRLPSAVLASLLAVALLVAAASEAKGERAKRAPARRAAPANFDRRAADLRPVRPNAAQAALQRSLGSQGVVQLDPRTGTPRVVAKLNGFLTAPSRGDAKDVVLDYVRVHRDVFRLDEDDLAALRVTRDYTDVAGVRHLIWAQTYRGIPAFDNDLRASVTKEGRIVNVMGSPKPDLQGQTTPSVSAAGAVARALRNVGRPGREPAVVGRGRGAARPTSFAGGHRANLVLVNDGTGMRLAWHVTAQADSDEVYDSLVDASSGEVLRRANKVADASAKAWDYYPGAASGGNQVDRSSKFVSPWVTTTDGLTGTNAHTFIDVDDDNVADASEEVNSVAWDDNFGFTTFQHSQGFCAPSRLSICSWNSFDGAPFGSWRTFRKQNATQVHYFVNTFHDHLKNDPSIGFNGASGNFEGADKVLAHSDDGAATGAAGSFLGADMPDANHVDNANMFTPPNGTSPTMQMYLFTSLTAVYASDPTPDVNGGDDASVVYHEYTHGLSNRLVTYSNGWGALDGPQSGAMGEAWSDWYAMDYLVAQGFAPDTVTDGDVTLDRYVGNGEHTLRSEGLDCPVGASPSDCPGAGTAGNGGYTYGDFGTIASGPEVHADGEIWAQTLWQLRGMVGVPDARFLVTEAMRLSPPDPSFLDMRNAILQADQVAGGVHAAHIWEVFADRGMGYFASSVFGFDGDVTPIEDFQLPPDPAQVGSLSGTVTNQDTGKPVAGVLVALAGHDSGFPGDLVATTNAAGSFTIADVPAGDYAELYAFKPGWDEVVVDPDPVTNGGSTPVPALQLRRDWASSRAGGRIASFTGPNFAAFCGTGPGGAINQALLSGWPSLGPPSGPIPRIVVKLPAYVDMTAFAIDPGPTCGDPADAGLQTFKIEVSKTGTSWSTVMTNSFGVSDQGHLNLFEPLVPTRKAVRYVRLSMLSNHGNANDFFDMSELEVYGTATPLCLGLPVTKIGTNAAETINGTAGADVILGLGGNDRIDGKGGTDVICGGDGNDTLIGGTGVDKIDGARGNDTIFSRDGRRELTLKGGTGTDRARKDASDRTSAVERFF
jgi:hypothetical protein